jgi:hypothetical protein
MVTVMTLFEKVKANLILEHERDDELLQMYINTAIAYAESYQHLPEGHYSENEMPPTTAFKFDITFSKTISPPDSSTFGIISSVFSPSLDSFRRNSSGILTCTLAT